MNYYIYIYIYIDIYDGIKLVFQPQHRMSPVLKDIVKDELQKLLTTKFIYPILDSEWVSPLVLVTKKGENDTFVLTIENSIRLLGNITFPYPLLIKFWIPYLEGNIFLLWMDLVDITKFILLQNIRTKLHSHTLGEFFSYRVLPFGLCNAPTTFQRVVLSIFS